MLQDSLWGPRAVTHQDPQAWGLVSRVSPSAGMWLRARELGSITPSPGHPVMGCPITRGDPIPQ